MDQRAEIDKRYFPSLSRVFSPIVMNDLMRRGSSDYLDEVVCNSRAWKVLDMSRRLRDFLDDLYYMLSRSYCNEYVYKNTLTEQVFSGHHSQNAHMLTELRVSSRKADVVVLNGTSTVYEIKSELDSFDRLDAQISAYTDFFDRINVITSSSQAEALRLRLRSDIGIMILAEDSGIEVLREPQSNLCRVKPVVIFGSLRKDEYLSIIEARFGSVPDVPNTKIHQVCFELFCSLSPEDAHNAMLSVLRLRGNSTLLKDFVQAAPHSLKAFAVRFRPDSILIDRFLGLLEQPASSVVSLAT